MECNYVHLKWTLISVSFLFQKLSSDPQPLAAEEFFEKMPRSEVTLEMAAYVYALQICAWIDREDSEALAAIYKTPRASLIKRVKGHLDGEMPSDWSDDLKALAEKFQLHVSLLDDFVQAQTLQNLGRGNCWLCLVVFHI